jgi:hypothetical protein
MLILPFPFHITADWVGQFYRYRFAGQMFFDGSV